MTWKEDICVECSALPDGVWSALQVWLLKPHTIDRRLCGSHCLKTEKFNTSLPSSNLVACMEKICSDLRNVAASKVDVDLILNCIHTCIDEICGKVDSTDATNDGDFLGLSPVSEIQVHIRELLPKNIERFGTLTEAVIIAVDIPFALFVPLTIKHNKTDNVTPSPDTPYMVKLSDHSLKLCIHGDTPWGSHTMGCTDVWLRNQLLPRLAALSHKELSLDTVSLKCVPVELYNATYQRLKATYAQDLVKNWPEKTDPQKFVYEDIAIAAYLLILWEKERDEKQLREKQSFVDLGCGNGLLVYLLSAEGYPGIGIDVRKRGIWDFYDPRPDLKELSITPSDASLFPKYDWLIGNHSDELTPWIPVIASRSSHNCRYFVLPCCFHDFENKFGEKRPGVSQYRQYLDYVADVGRVCGFEVDEDTLRIPSTKRICFIGKGRTYEPECQAEIDAQISSFIKSRSVKSQNSTLKSDKLQNGQKEGEQGQTDSAESTTVPKENEAWAVHFKPRAYVQQVKNCTRVAKDVKDAIINSVFKAVMFATPQHGNQVVKADGKTWNRGGRVPLGELVELFDQATLGQLKNECGGLQTLLRNCHQVFLVCQGHVQLRVSHDEPERPRKKKQKVKKSPVPKVKLCWYHDNHPDGCYASAQDCNHAHGTEDLQIPEPE